MASRGATLVLHGRDDTLLKDRASTLPNTSRHEWIIADLSREDDLKSFAQEVKRRYPRLDVLVHSAGILGPRSSLEDYPLDDWNTVIRVNLTAPFRITQALLPMLRKAKHPSIIFVSSGVGHRGSAEWGAYSVSKFGVEGLTQVLADELHAEGIRVNAINPGGTRTRMRAQAFPEEDPNTLPTPEQIAPVFVELASPENKLSGRSIEAREHPAYRSGFSVCLPGCSCW
jgi:NAD(P)-dependent dehydrogenase (short-subunit alcohol dehydrogenase family)